MLFGLQEVALPSLFAKRAWTSERLAARAFGLAACACCCCACACCCSGAVLTLTLLVGCYSVQYNPVPGLAIGSCQTKGGRGRGSASPSLLCHAAFIALASDAAGLPAALTVHHNATASAACHMLMTMVTAPMPT